MQIINEKPKTILSQCIDMGLRWRGHVILSQCIDMGLRWRGHVILSQCIDMGLHWRGHVILSQCIDMGLLWRGQVMRLSWPYALKWGSAEEVRLCDYPEPMNWHGAPLKRPGYVTILRQCIDMATAEEARLCDYPEPMHWHGAPLERPHAGYATPGSIFKL